MRDTLLPPPTTATPLDPLAAHLWTLGWALLATMATTDEPEADLDDDDREPADEEKPEPWAECGTCGGSGGGEGYWRCQSCGGRGSVRNESWWDDRAAFEADRMYDQTKDERAERGGA